MARPKIPRKSTTVDMTAMCDVAFLLLSFFILTTKPKPSEAVPIQTPTSVAAKIAPEKDLVMISLNKDGKAFLSTGDDQADKDAKQQIIETVNTNKGLGLSPEEIARLKAQPFIGSSLAQLKQQARMSSDQITGQILPGIPVKDTANNEMTDWMRAVAQVYAGRKPNILLKGDNQAQFPQFKNIVTALKKNDLLKFQMVTNPEAIPAGSTLFQAIKNGDLKAAE
ncbi:MAG TPA: biopolymer transporter ExbD [Chitinophagaceae bacterium]|nr:biopolymer transporter ExbD [Chitinophagaceae bacterium]